jgi:hypothetical protein
VLWKDIVAALRALTPALLLGLVLAALWFAVPSVAAKLSAYFTSPERFVASAAIFPTVAASSTLTMPTSTPAAKPKEVKVSPKPTPSPPPQSTPPPLIPMANLTPVPSAAMGNNGQQTAPSSPVSPPPATATPKPPLAPKPTAPKPPTQSPAPKPPPSPLPPSPTPPASGKVAFSDTFTSYPDGIITNEFAHWNPTDGNAKNSPNWELTSGSLFAKGGAGWTGIPDSGTAPNNVSSNVTGSGIFRLTTKRADFLDVKVSFDLNMHKFHTGATTPAVDWDGTHIFLRYQSQYHLYYASINRRDNTVIIKKKVPGGPSNNGTYYNLSQGGIKYTVPFNTWQKVEATIKNESDGSVTINLYAGGKLLTTAKDTGLGGPPIRTAGKTGIRGDNADFAFKNFTVTKL